MIKYALTCDGGHLFDAWFRDSSAYDQQKAAGQVACAECMSPKVEKAMMAPALRRGAARPPRTEVASVEAAQPQPARPAPPPASDEDKSRRLRALLRELHGHLRDNAENVGPAFAEEARMIHDGGSPARAIYGTATGEEVRELHEDGIEVLPLPTLPDDRN